MKSKMPVSTIMTKDLLILEAEDTLRDAESTFSNYSLRHAPVVSDGELVGMFSLIDLKNIEDDALDRKRPYQPTLVKHVMTHDPIHAQVNDNILEVATLFTEHDFHAIPILDGEKIVGIVSTTDIIRFFLENLDEE